jgi:YVTN family beta-propeller protein
MSERSPQKSPSPSEKNPILANRKHRRSTISILLRELERIHEWNRVQKKKKDGQYRTQAGQFLNIDSKLICSEECFLVLNCVLTLLKEEEAADQWQEAVCMAYCNSLSHENFLYICAMTDEEWNIRNRINIESPPSAIAITPDGTKVYVVDEFIPTLSVMSLNECKIIATIPLKVPNNRIANVPLGKMAPKRIAITLDGKRVYVTNGNNIFVIDTDINEVIDTIPAEMPSGVAVTDGTKLYVTNGLKEIFVIALDSYEVITTIPMDRPCCDIAITSDGKELYAVTTNGVYIIDTDTHKVITTIFIKNPDCIAITPDSTRIYVSHSFENFYFRSNVFSVISTDNHTVIHTYGNMVGYENPSGIAIGMIWCPENRCKSDRYPISEN